MSVTGPEALALIEQRLGRPVLDPLEAAVVLEAFAGLESDTALRLGAEAIESREVPAKPETEPRNVEGIAFDFRSIFSDIAFVVGVLLVSVWLAHDRETWGASSVDRAWRIALPVSIGAQWFLRRRCLVGPEGLGRLRGQPGLLWPIVAGSAMLLVVPDGPFALALAATWIGGFIITRRGLGAVHAALIAASFLGSRWLDPKWVLALLAGASVAGAGLVIALSVRSVRAPGSLLRSIPSGLIGVFLALFLVSEPAVEWRATSLMVTATIVPALIGSIVGGVWMTRIWTVVGLELSERRIGERRISSGPFRVFLQAVLLSITTSLLCSFLVVWFARHDPTLGDSPLSANEPIRWLLVAHAALAIAGLCVSLLESFGYWGWALASAGLGSAVALTYDVFVNLPGPGERILSGAVVAVAVAVPALLVTVLRPGHRIAVSV